MAHPGGCWWLSGPVAAASSRTAVRFRNASEESCLTSSLPPCKPPTTTTATMKPLLTQPAEEYVAKWLHYGPQPDERWVLLFSCPPTRHQRLAWSRNHPMWASPAPSALCGNTVVACAHGSCLPQHAVPQRGTIAACLLTPAHCCRMLLLEDAETGDILTLLVYAQPLFGENYSRKLANKAWSTVPEPPGSWLLNAAKPVPRLWRAAFESSQATKAMVKGCNPQAPRVRMPALMLLAGAQES